MITRKQLLLSPLLAFFGKLLPARTKPAPSLATTDPSVFIRVPHPRASEPEPIAGRRHMSCYIARHWGEFEPMHVWISHIPPESESLILNCDTTGGPLVVHVPESFAGPIETHLVGGSHPVTLAMDAQQYHEITVNLSADTKALQRKIDEMLRQGCSTFSGMSQKP